MALCAILLIAPRSLVAAPAFSSSAWPQDTGAPVNSSPVLGDLDGDGVLEIVIGSDNNKVYAWKPDGTLMPGWPVTTNDSVRSSPALADVDGDGHLEVIVGSFDNKVYVWNFHGSILPGWPASTGSVIYSSPAVGDIDGDQLPEIVVGSFDNKVYAWNADGSLVRNWPKPTGLFVYSSPALADVDRDGVLDVIIGTDNNRVFAWKGDGSDIDGWPVATEHVVPSSPAVGDLDHDGEVEIVAASWDKVFVWNTKGERKAGWPVTTGHQIPSSPALADLNNDGTLEVIIGCKDGKVYAWNANGQPAPGWPAVTDGEISGAPAVGDVDGDGTLEVVIGSKDNKVYMWTAQGVLVQGWPRQTKAAITSSPAMGDIDGNGTIEIVIGSKDQFVYAWTFPRVGAQTPKIAWQGFRGNPAHSGRYGDAAPAIAVAAAPTQAAPKSGDAQVLVEQPPISRQPVIPTVAGQILDLTVTNYDKNSLTLAWTSPSGMFSPQAVYDLRFAAQPITEESWEKAEKYSETIHPSPAGTQEMLTIKDLQLPTLQLDGMLYIAMRMSDGAGQANPLSNVVRIEQIDEKAPAKIEGFAVRELDQNTLELSWKATGDDENQGAATTYDIRYSDVPLTDLTWVRAIQASNMPAPLPAGTSQTFQVLKPWNDKEIFWAIRAIDDALNLSPLSDVVAWSPVSREPFARIVDLSIAENTLTWTAPGKRSHAEKTDKAGRYDIRYAEYPLTEADWDKAARVENAPAPETAGTPHKFLLNGIPEGKKLFFALKTLDESGAASEISNVVEVLITERNAPEAITDIAIEELTKESVTLNWTAPQQTVGDKSETVSKYEVRYSVTPLTEETWEAAAVAQDVPAPASPKTLETFILKNAPKDTEYYVAVKSFDDLGKASPLSNVVRIPMFDAVAPAPIIDLAVEDAGKDWVKISWTATGDNGSDGQAAKQLIRLAPSLKAVKAWTAATDIENDVFPSISGTKDSYTITGLNSNATYFIALKSADAFGNESEISNIVRAKTLDSIAPGAISDLRIAAESEKGVVLQWTAPGENEMEGQAKAYDLRYSQETITSENWELLPQKENMPAPQPAGSTEKITLTDLEANTKYYVAVVALDASGNPSPLSNTVEIVPGDTLAPEGITTLWAENVDNNSVFLGWLSPGDDELHPMPSRYEIRYSREPLNEDTWKAAKAASDSPKPSPQGEKEQFLLSGLQKNSMYYLGVKAIDAAGNVAPISNVVRIFTSDDVVKDLEILEFDQQTVTLTWTAPGGALPEHNRMYDIRYATTPLTEDSWENADPVRNLPHEALLARDPGQKEQVTLTGLPQYEQVFFGVRVLTSSPDNQEQRSVLSNVVELNRLDVIPPAEITTLKIKDMNGAQGGMHTFEISWQATGDNDFEGVADRYDIRYGTTQPTEANWESLTPIQPLPAPQSAGSFMETTAHIPAGEDTLYFAIRSYDEALNSSALSNIAQWVPEDPVAPAPVQTLHAERLQNGDIKLTWIAPGDNDQRGTAAFYDIRYAQKEGDVKKWNAATVVPNEPLPEAAGTEQEYILKGMRQDVAWYIALKTTDDARNTSQLSNIVMLEKAPVAAISDLTFVSGTANSVTLTWTAPRDRVAERVQSYDIRYAEDRAILETWKQATVVKHELMPRQSGAGESITLEQLAPNKRYYVAIKATDHAKETSQLSNIAIAFTADTAPPAAINNLSASKAELNAVTVTWTVVEDDAIHDIPASYEIRYATAPLSEANWNAATVVVNDLQPTALASQMEYTIGGLEESHIYYVGIRAKDLAGNVSALSNTLLARTKDHTPPQAVADLRAFYPTPTSVLLSWTAPADVMNLSSDPRSADLQSGLPLEEMIITGYDIRYLNAANGASLTEENWEQAEKVLTPPAPLAPGTAEQFAVRNLAADQAYIFAIRAIDSSGNVSAISNLAAETTLPADFAAPVTATRVLAESDALGWRLIQGQNAGQLQADASGSVMLQANGERKMPGKSAMTAVYPATNEDVSVPQGELQFTVKATEPFFICAKVNALESREIFNLCYANQQATTAAPDAQNADAVVQTITKTPRMRLENYIFFPLDDVALDNQWHDIRRDLTKDLMEGAGQAYGSSSRFYVRGTDVSVRGLVVEGVLFTSLTDFEERLNPLENGWKLHFGTGAVELLQEPLTSDPGAIGAERQGGQNNGASQIQNYVITGIKPRGLQGVVSTNFYLHAQSADSTNLVLTYPQSGMVQVSEKPYFLADVKAGSEFKLILKVLTKDNREVYVGYLPETVLQTTAASSGNYFYFPLNAVSRNNGWMQVVADLAGDLRKHQIEYAATTWLSFHGQEISLDNLGFSTGVLKNLLK